MFVTGIVTMLIGLLPLVGAIALRLTGREVSDRSLFVAVFVSMAIQFVGLLLAFIAGAPAH